MGNKQSSLLGSLAGWWYTMQYNETIIFGPQLGFNIRSPEGKTILIFGEDHRYNDIKECDTEQKSFVNLYEEMLLQPKCESMQVILEISEDYKKAINTNIQGNRIFTMLKRYYQSYKHNSDCRILLQFANLDSSNILLLRNLQTIKKSVDKNSLINNTDFIERLYLDIRNMCRLFDRNIINFNIPEKQDKILNDTLIEPLNNDIISLTDKLEKLTLDNIEDMVTKAYYISLRIMDVYAISSILANNLNSVVYMGLLHSTFIVSYLVTHFNYHLLDAANPISDHCIKIDNESFDNVYAKIKRLIESKDTTAKEYLIKNFENIEKKINDKYTAKTIY